MNRAAERSSRGGSGSCTILPHDVDAKNVVEDVTSHLPAFQPIRIEYSDHGIKNKLSVSFMFITPVTVFHVCVCVFLMNVKSGLERNQPQGHVLVQLWPFVVLLCLILEKSKIILWKIKGPFLPAFISLLKINKHRQMSPKRLLSFFIFLFTLGGVVCCLDIY